MEDQKKISSYLLIAVLAIVWGSSFILMKKGLNVYSWDQVGALRMFVSFIVLFPFVWKSFNRIDKASWKFIAVSGICGNCIPAFLFPLAETKLDSGIAGIMNSFTPLFTLIVGLIFFGTTISRNRIAGVLIGLLGAVMIVLARTSGIMTEHIEYSLLIVLSTLCYAFSVNILRHKLVAIDSIMISGYALMFAGIPSGIYLFTTDFINRTNSTNGSWKSFSAIIILGVFGTAISTFLFNKLIKISSALFASSVTYLIPFVAILWGFGFGEHLGAMHLAGLGAILFGVYLINKKTGS
jgi:drug/metabolite transporter (DMT)-like permease